MPKECRFNPDITYGTMTDERDGKVYRTVIISGDVWMAENLNYDPGLGGSDSTKYEWSWCYYNEPKNCDVAGRLYTWAAAIDSVSLATDADNPMDCGLGKTCTLPDTLKGICPPGWHLPNKDEWSDLFYVVGGGGSTVGRCLKSRIAWSDASDNVGFSALPAGGWFDEDTGFDDFVLHTYFWGSNDFDEEEAYNMCLYDNDTFEHLKPYYKSFGFSVRCIKNR